MMQAVCRSALIAAVVVATPVCAVAQDLVYTPVNPSFGGNALNSSHLLSIANAERPEAPRSNSGDSSLSSADRFVRTLQSRLFSSLASDITEAILGEDAQDSGTFKLDDLEVSFENVGDVIDITIIDLVSGEVTEISVPTVE